MQKNHRDYGLVFWIHFIIVFIIVFSWVLFSWWIVILIQILLHVQYRLVNGCILTRIEFGNNEACIPYYLHKWKIVKDKEKTRTFFTYHVTAIVIILSLIWQFLLGFKPLIF